MEVSSPLSHDQVDPVDFKSLGSERKAGNKIRVRGAFQHHADNQNLFIPIAWSVTSVAWRNWCELGGPRAGEETWNSSVRTPALTLSLSQNFQKRSLVGSASLFGVSNRRCLVRDDQPCSVEHSSSKTSSKPSPYPNTRKGERTPEKPAQNKSIISHHRPERMPGPFHHGIFTRTCQGSKANTQKPTPS